MSTNTPHAEQPHCRRCHRTLRSAASIATGYGPTCLRRERAERAAEAAAIKADTLAKAREDIADGAIVDTRRTTKAGRRIFAVVSSDGTRTYLATPAGACTCRAGLKGQHRCRHSAAALLLTA